MKSTTQTHERLVELASGFNSLGFQLYGHVPRSGNFFLSPFSVSTALSALLLGARGRTRDELAALLGCGSPTAEWRKGVAELLLTLMSHKGVFEEYDEETGQIVTSEKEFFHLHVANAVFCQEGYSLLDSYRQMLKSDLMADLASVDFERPAAAAQQVNSWVKRQTAGRISNIIDPSCITPDWRLVLANAIYFMGQWSKPFEEGLTAGSPFHPDLDGTERSPVRVNMMRNTLHLNYMSDEKRGFEAVEIPYRTGAVSMFVVLPKRGRFVSVEEGLDAALVEEIIGAVHPCEVRIELPKFTISSSAELTPVLDELGVKDALDGHRADFGGITSDPMGLAISRVIHQAWIKVDEAGTEAAAATAIMAELGCAEEEPPTPVPFIADRPFLFLIRGRQTGTVLFIGRVVDPTE